MGAWGLGLTALTAVMCVLPFMISLYRLDILIFLLINVILVVSYRFLTLAGEYSLGHVVMMGVGAYGSALATREIGLSVWLAAPLAALFTGALAFVLAFPLFRMKGFYFLIGSFAAGEAIRLTWNRFREPFGGPGGINFIPSPEIDIPGLGYVDVSHPRAYYFLCLALVIITIAIFYRLERSRIGLTLHATHWRDVLAESVGVNIWRYKTFALVVASAFAGLAGALLGHYVGTINPPQFSLHIMLFVLVWVIVGGTRSIAGPVLGVTILTVIDELLHGFDEWRPLIYGVILICSVLFLPDGLESLPRRALGGWRWLRGGRAMPAPRKEASE
jgi:branched-chain amino acid transport system permease protein